MSAQRLHQPPSRRLPDLHGSVVGATGNPAASSAECNTPDSATLCVEDGGWPIGGNVPQPDGAIESAADDRLTVRAQRYAPDPALVSIEGRYRSPARRLPQSHRSVEAATGGQPAIGAAGHAAHSTGMGI